MGVALGEIEAQTGLELRLLRRLAGGEQDDAHLVAADDRLLVLKLQAEPWKVQRLIRAAPVVEYAVSHGWPAARWVSTGILADRTAFILQEYVVGVPVSTLDEKTMQAILAGNALQSGLATAEAPDDCRQLESVLSGDCSWKAAVDDRSAAGAGLVRHGDDVIGRLGTVQLPATDVVHGDYSSSNMLLAGDGTIRFIDCETIGAGTRVRDLADLYRQCFVYPGTSTTVMRMLRAEACAVAGPEVFSTCVVAVSYNNLAWWVEHRSVADFNDACERLHALFDDIGACQNGGR